VGLIATIAAVVIPRIPHIFETENQENG